MIELDIPQEVLDDLMVDTIKAGIRSVNFWRKVVKLPEPSYLWQVTHPASPGTVLVGRNVGDWVLSLPGGTFTDIKLDPDHGWRWTKIVDTYCEQCQEGMHFLCKSKTCTCGKDSPTIHPKLEGNSYIRLCANCLERVKYGSEHMRGGDELNAHWICERK